MGALEFQEGLIEAILYKYYVEHKGYEKIFEETGHPFIKIWDFIHWLNVEVPVAIKTDEEVICRLYADLEMSSRKVAEIIGKSQPYVTKILNDHHLIRSNPSKKPSSKATPAAIKKILEEHTKEQFNPVYLQSLDDRIVPGHPLYDKVYSNESLKIIYGKHYGEDVKVKCICDNCGGPFEAYSCYVKGRKNLFCKPSCHHEWMEKHQCGENNPNWKGKTIGALCEYCHMPIKKELSDIKKEGQLLFCDNICSAKYKEDRYIGEGNPNWVDGNSYGDYCHKFNDNLKERVRWFFADSNGVRRCFLCGAPEPETGARLPVHHVDYDKSTCCNGKTPYLVPLCQNCHNKTSGKHVRKQYEEELKKKLLEQTGGKCFFTKEEFCQFVEEHPEYFCV